MTPPKPFFKESASVSGCKNPLEKYFHPPDFKLAQKFAVLYKLGDVTDSKLAELIGVDRTSMNRYRRGIWKPDNDLKIKICQKLSELLGKQVDSLMLWGNEPFNLEERKNAID